MVKRKRKKTKFKKKRPKNTKILTWNGKRYLCTKKRVKVRNRYKTVTSEKIFCRKIR